MNSSLLKFILSLLFGALIVFVIGTALISISRTDKVTR